MCSPPSAQDLRITVTTISGDPDIYVAVYNPNAPLFVPTQTNYTWMSAAWGNDALNISHNSPQYQAPATYIIGVYGFQTSQFVIVATTTADAVITAADGIPQVCVCVAVCEPPCADFAFTRVCVCGCLPVGSFVPRQHQCAHMPLLPVLLGCSEQYHADRDRISDGECGWSELVCDKPV